MQNPLILAAILFVAAPAFLSGQSYRGTVNEGNELYRQKKYDAAREKYERAASVEAERPESYFNSGNTAYRSDDVKAALEEYEKAGLRFKDKQRIAQTLYNAGNTFLNAAEKGAENPMLQQAAGDKTEDLRMEGYRQAIEMYKKALKLNPEDADARYNLTYARKKLEDLQKQQQNQDQNKDKQQQKQKDQDKEQDQQNQDKNKQEEQQKKDQQDQEQQKQQNQKGENEQDKAKQEQQKQPQPDKDQQMSKQQAEQILRALQREEKELQKKKRQEQGRRVDVEKDW